MSSLVQSTRFRWITFAVIVVAVSALTGIFVVRAIQDQKQKQIPTAATVRDQALDLRTVIAGPHVVFRSTAPGPTFGFLAAVPLDAPSGPRAVSRVSCERVYASADAGICLQAKTAALQSFKGEFLDNRLAPVKQFPVNGIPSRARLSADGTMAATTAFVSGHSYASLGFSTETDIFNRATGKSYGNLELTFTKRIDPRRNQAADLNVWGVTFSAIDPNLFYATVATGGQTFLTRGDLKARTLTKVRTDAECPSLSPDGRTLVYKKQAGRATTWRYHALDLATGQEWALPETRSVDDQAEWLDNSHVLYGLPRGGSSESDVWVTDIRTGEPTVFMPDAESPAVVRDAG